MGARILTYAAFAGFLALFVGLLAPALIPHRSAPPYEIVESLVNPMEVVDWNGDGLLLADGRRIQLRGISKLPSTSEALQQTTQSGVEVDTNGDVFGLVRVHHWCGNDPCRLHMARVNLAHVLMYFRQGELIDSLPESLAQLRPIEVPQPFSEWGWSIRYFSNFQLWSRMAADEGV